MAERGIGAQVRVENDDRDREDEDRIDGAEDRPERAIERPPYPADIELAHHRPLIRWSPARMSGNGSRDQDRRWRRPQSGSVDDLGGFAGLSACPIHAWRDERARRPNAKRPVTAAPG